MSSRRCRVQTSAFARSALDRERTQPHPEPVPPTRCPAGLALVFECLPLVRQERHDRYVRAEPGLSVLQPSGHCAETLFQCQLAEVTCMVDHLSPEARSVNMSRSRGANTSPEVAVRRIAHRMGLRFRLHRRDLPGTPDLLLPRHRLAVFVHGCFWHRHAGCSRATTPQSRTAFWLKKFSATVERDVRQEAALGALGWKVLTIWECDIKRPGLVEARLNDATRPDPGGSHIPLPQ